MYSATFGCNFYISTKSIWTNVSFKASVSFIFCLDNLSTDVSGMFKFPSINMLQSTSPFRSLNICFMYLVAMLAVIYVYNFCIFLDGSFVHYVMSFVSRPGAGVERLMGGAGAQRVQDLLSIH